MKDTASLSKGQIVSYILPVLDSPINLYKHWRGRILYVYRSRSAVYVEVLETGWKTRKEIVYYDQIMEVLPIYG